MTTISEQQEVSSPCSLRSFLDSLSQRQHSSLKFNQQNSHSLLHYLSMQHLHRQRRQRRRRLLQQVAQQLCPRHQNSKFDVGQHRQTSPLTSRPRSQLEVELHRLNHLRQVEQASRRLRWRLQVFSRLQALL